MNTTTSTMTFQGIELAPLTRDKQIWLRLPQIEAALGYANKGKALAKIFARHADEFTKSMTRVLKLKTAGGMQSVRIFSLRGAHLLAMFARTDVAKAFRVWVLNVLDAEVAKPAQQQVKSYHYPLQAADPHDRKFGNAWLSPRVLTDPKNRPLEIELIEQLEKDGHDVMGAKMRIMALRDVATRAEQMRAQYEEMARCLGPITERLKVLGFHHGKNVVFAGGLDPDCAIDRHVYGAQMKVTA